MRSRGHLAASLFRAVFVSLTLFLAACGGQTTAETATREPALESEARTSVFDGKATIVLPKGFRAATEGDRKKLKQSEPRREEVFVGSVDGRSIETERFSGLATDAATLADIKVFNERLHAKYSNWERSEIVNIKGREWYVFEWKEPEEDGSISSLVAPVDEDSTSPEPGDTRPRHYVNYITLVDGAAYGIFFGAIREDMPNTMNDFFAAFNSIKFKN